MLRQLIAKQTSRGFRSWHQEYRLSTGIASSNAGDASTVTTATNVQQNDGESENGGEKKSAIRRVYYMSFQGYEHRKFGQWVEKVALMGSMLPDIDMYGPVTMPTRKSMFTPLRSPHKFKKGQEHYSFDRHRRMIRVDGTDDTVDRFVDMVKGMQEPVVSMRITKHTFYPLGAFYSGAAERVDIADIDDDFEDFGDEEEEEQQQKN
jgi:small subunit ribosomal protein S10